MQTIRKGVFETNSSSTHSICICTDDEFTKWKNGQMYYIYDKDKLITPEEYDILVRRWLIDEKSKCDWDARTQEFNGKIYSLKDDEELYSPENLNLFTTEEVEEFKQGLDYYDKGLTYDEYYDDINYETYEETYTTPSGDKIVAFGYYGNN